MVEERYTEIVVNMVTPDVGGAYGETEEQIEEEIVVDSLDNFAIVMEEGGASSVSVDTAIVEKDCKYNV